MRRKTVESYPLFGEPRIETSNIFQGENMRCEVCSTEKKSNPDVESNWTCVELGGDWGTLLLYVCPKHYLPDVIPNLVKKALERLNRAG